MSISAPMNFIMVNTFNVPKYGDMTILPSQICLSSSKSTPECCKICPPCFYSTTLIIVISAMTTCFNKIVKPIKVT